MLIMNIDDKTIYHNLNKFQNYYSWGKNGGGQSEEPTNVMCIFGK